MTRDAGVHSDPAHRAGLRLGAAVILLGVILAGCRSTGAPGGDSGAPKSHSKAAPGPGSGGPESPAGSTTPSEDGGSPAASASEDPKPPIRRFTIAATGDILSHSPVYERALLNGGDHYDFAPMFRKVKPLLSRADIAICHLETPLSPNDQNLSSYPVFNVPHELADAIKGARYDYCSTASNHSYDQGPGGVKATLKVLDRAGVQHNGTARSLHEADRPQLIRVNGVTVGLLSYTYGLNGFQLPPGQAWLVDVIDVRSILREARAARSAGAEFVILSLHWGSEYQATPNAQQLALGKRLLRSPAIDLILGHHAHVVQPIERVRKEYLVYGMGNFLSNQSIACCPEETTDGVIVNLEVKGRGDRFRVDRVTYTPTWVEIGPFVVTPVGNALKGHSVTAETRAALRESWSRTVHAIRLLGAKGSGVTPSPRL